MDAVHENNPGHGRGGKAVSLIIAAYNARDCIGNCLAAVLDTDFRDFEIIVVDDGSTDATAARAREFPCTVITGADNRGPAAARNTGAAAARGSLLLFTDTDCVPGKDWVAGMYESYRRLSRHSPGLAAVGGRVLPNGRFISKCVAYAGYYAFQHGSAPVERPDLCAADLLVVRSAFEAVGRFDESMRNGEDTELTCRLAARGYRVVYDPGQSVVHDHRKSLAGYLNHQWAWGKGHGLRLETEYRGVRRLPKFAVCPNPYVYLLALCVPVSLAITARSVGANLRYDWRVLVYAPFIFLGKLWYRFGVVSRLFELRRQHVKGDAP